MVGHYKKGITMVNNVYTHIIPLAVALVGLLGQHAFATNESSYRLGLKYG